MEATGAAAQQSQTGTNKEIEAAQAESQAGEKAPAAKPEDPSLPEIVVKSAEKPKAKKAKAKAKPAGEDSPGGAVAGAATEAAPVDKDAVLFGQSSSDTGTTVFDANAIRLRTDGSGDANSFLRNLPNVQYQNDTSTDAGAHSQKLIDTRPLLLSINGGRSYENKFILNGVGMSTITGPLDLNDAPLNDNTLTPNADGIFGLHPQQIFVPSEFLSQATVIDSNASAEYGEFQGGVVIYDLTKPPTDRYHMTINYSRQTDEMVSYILGTPNGTNPLDRKTPTFEKNNLAASIGAPITSDLSFIVQASQKTAASAKQKDYTLYSGRIDEDSENRFFRGAATLRTDIGKFTLDSSHTDYSQYWEGYAYRDLVIEVDGQSTSTQLEYLGDLPALAYAPVGLGGVKLESRVYYNDSETANDSNGNVVYNWTGARRVRNATTGVWSTDFDLTVFDDWCRPVPIETLPNSGTQSVTTCREGGYGDKVQGQADLGAQGNLTGSVFLGNFRIGGEAKSIEGHRARLEDYIMHGQVTTAPPGEEITCPTGDAGCTSQQFASRRNIYPAFDVTKTVNAIHGYAELDQTLWWFNVRAGVRVDYEDYFENLNVAPRLAGTVMPFRGLSVTGGYNRYYLGETLYYALRDGQPRGFPPYTRTYDYSTDVMSPWGPEVTAPVYGYKDSGVETPYTDEYTGAIRIADPLLGGQIRLKYLERYAEDRFSSNPCPGVANCIQLNNDADSFYRSATAEYAKYWHDLDTPFFLSGAGVTTQVTWSEQSSSRNGYFDDDDSDVHILYDKKSYTLASFTEVTGNLDIPIRIGATLETTWFNDMMLLGLSVGYNLGYTGVYDTGINQPYEGLPHDVWGDKKFGATLLLDLVGQVNVTEHAAIEFQVNNILNSEGNSTANNNNPWIVGRTFWAGSILRF